MQTAIITAGLLIAAVAAFWPRKTRTGWRANDWVAAAGMAAAVGGLLIR